MLATGDTIDSPPSKVRSRKGNGTSLFLGRVDARSAPARRQKELEADLLAEMGGQASGLQKHRIHIMAGLMVRQELLVAGQARGEDSGDELVRVCNLLNRERLLLGLKVTANHPPAASSPSIDWASMLAADGGK